MCSWILVGDTRFLAQKQFITHGRAGSWTSGCADPLHKSILALGETLYPLLVPVKWMWKSLSSVSLFVTLWTSPWNSPGQNTGVGSLSFLQGIFPTQVSNPDFPYCRRILYQLETPGKPNCIYFSCASMLEKTAWNKSSYRKSANINDSWRILSQQWLTSNSQMSHLPWSFKNNPLWFPYLH